MYLLPTTEPCKEGIERRLIEHALWSFEAASINREPLLSASDEPLDKKRSKRAGDRIIESENIYLTYSGSTGDWKWQVEQCHDFRIRMRITGLLLVELH